MSALLPDRPHRAIELLQFLPMKAESSAIPSSRESCQAFLSNKLIALRIQVKPCSICFKSGLLKPMSPHACTTRRAGSDLQLLDTKHELCSLISLARHPCGGSTCKDRRHHSVLAFATAAHLIRRTHIDGRPILGGSCDTPLLELLMAAIPRDTVSSCASYPKRRWGVPMRHLDHKMRNS